MRSLFTGILLLSFASHLLADLPYMPVSFRLSSDKKVYHPGERMEFRLTVINADWSKPYPIILPGSQNKGAKLIRIQFYHVNEKTNFYTCVGKEEPQMQMNCKKAGGQSVKFLKPGDSLQLVFYLNDPKNYPYQTASHHKLDKELPPGKYEVLIFYDPSESELKQLYHYIWSTNDSTSAEKLNFWLGGNPSNYTPVEINSSAKGVVDAGSCKPNCSFCHDIEQQNWEGVKKEIKKNIHRDPDFEKAVDQGQWMLLHRNVAWLSPPPDEVLSSLPTYFGREIFFRSRGEILYYYMQFQMGIVYRPRSRMHNLFHSGRFDAILPGEDLDYIGLTGFGELVCR